MKHRRKSTRLILIFVLLGGGVALALLWANLGGLFTAGSTSVERWCGDQVRLIADDLLKPKLTFDEFDYKFPGTLTLHNVRLTDGDDVCLETESIRLILRDIPARGKPIVIDTVEMVSPVVRIVVRIDGTLAGFTGFVQPSAGRRHEDGGSSLPSDFLAVRKLTIENGRFRWTASDGAMMELDDLDFVLNGKPEGDPGWYALDASLVREPVLKYDMSGRFQIDQFMLDLAELSLNIELDDKTQRNLPPQLQTMIKAYEVQGKLAVTGKAMIPIPSPNDSSFDLKASLSDAHFASGSHQVPVDQLTMGLGLTDQQLVIDSIQGNVFGGHIQGNASIDIAKQMFAEITLKGEELRLERALKEAAEVDTKLAGKIQLDGSASASLLMFPDDLAGGGKATLDDGHLWGNSFYKNMMVKMGKEVSGKDYGATDFTLLPDRVELKSFYLVGDASAAHGDGEMYYDGRINFRFNTGRMDRVQTTMGPIGDAFRFATDRIMAYQVTGTWSEPEFKVLPFRLGAQPEKSDPEKK